MSFGFFTHVNKWDPFVVPSTVSVHNILLLFTLFVTFSIYAKQSLQISLAVTYGGRNNQRLTFFVVRQQIKCMSTISETSDRSQSTVYWVAWIIMNDAVCSGEFSIYRDSKLPYSVYTTSIHCNIQEKIELLYYFSSVNSGLVDRISVILVSIKLYTIKISSTYLK